MNGNNRPPPNPYEPHQAPPRVVSREEAWAVQHPNQPQNLAPQAPPQQPAPVPPGFTPPLAPQLADASNVPQHLMAARTPPPQHTSVQPTPLSPGQGSAPAGGLPHVVKWQLNPPPGVRFVNEFGGSVTIEFPIAMAEQVYVTIVSQAWDHLKAAAELLYRSQATQAAVAAPYGVTPPGTPNHAMNSPMPAQGSGVGQSQPQGPLMVPGAQQTIPTNPPQQAAPVDLGVGEVKKVS